MKQIAIVLFVIAISFMIFHMMSLTTHEPGKTQSNSVRGTLEPIDKDHYSILIQTTGKKGVSFIDLPDQAAGSDQFYRILIRKNGQIFETSPGEGLGDQEDEPRVEWINPVGGYNRSIRPFNYGLPEDLEPPYEIAVKYVLTEKAKELAARLAPKGDSSLHFETNVVRVN